MRFFLKRLMKTIRNTPTELQSKPVGKLFSCGSGQMRFTPIDRLSAGGKELCGNVIILENDLEHKAPDGEIAFFHFCRSNLAFCGRCSAF